MTIVLIRPLWTISLSLTTLSLLCFLLGWGDSDIHIRKNWTSSLCAGPTAWPSTLPVVWMVIPSRGTPWAAPSIAVLSAHCNCCQKAPGAEAGGSFSGAGGKCQEPHTAGASCICHWDTFPIIYHPMHKGWATGRECLAECFWEKRGINGFMETTSWQQLKVPGKSRRKMRMSELPSDCTRQHWFINCGWTVLHGNWLYPLHSVNKKVEELWRMSMIWELPVDSLLVLTC